MSELKIGQKVQLKFFDKPIGTIIQKRSGPPLSSDVVEYKVNWESYPHEGYYIWSNGSDLVPIEDDRVALVKAHRHLKWAEEVIRRGVELMPIEQLNQWTGVRAWQESLDLVMDEKEEDE